MVALFTHVYDITTHLTHILELSLNVSIKTVLRHATSATRTCVLSLGLLGLTGLAATTAFAQQVTPEQLAQFKKLPRAQQEALAKQYGVDLSSISTAVQQQVVTNPQVVKPAVANPSEAKEEKVVESGAKETTADIKESRNATPALAMFGYDLFAGVPTTFAPATDIPVPAEYIVGPGDNINLNFYGKTNSQITVVVDREGKINVPELGPIHVAGLSFQELKVMMNEEVKQRTIGLSVITTLGELRSVRIFILGEANRPGSYTVSALSTITNALFVSGGIKKTGSLRNIQLKRNGELVSSFDLYDLLLRGDTSADVRVLPGDVIFVPPIGQTVGIGGEVKRSAVFELKDETTFADLVELSGGFLPTTYLPATKVNRIDARGQRTVIDLDLAQADNLNKPLRNGDLVRVFSILDSLEDVVTLTGHVYRPGNYAFTAGMTVADLVDDVKDVLPNVDLGYALIRREVPNTREIYFEQFALRDVFAGQAVALAKRDKVIIFANDGERDGLIAGDIRQLRAQTALSEPAKVVSVNGPVRQPGTYPFMQGMTVKDVMSASGNLMLNAEEDYAVLIRTNETRDLEALTLSLSDEAKLSVALQPEDTLYVFSKDQDRADALAPVIARLQAQVTKEVANSLITIEGEVRYPGTYPYSSNMSVSELVAAAGGLTESAYLKQAEVSRFVTDTVSEAERTTFEIVLEEELQSSNVTLAPKDVLQIKRIPQWYENQYINLAGEFRFPGRYLIRDGETIADVIERAGGFTNFAYPNAAVFLRPSVAQQQLREIRRLETRLEKDLSIAMAAKAMSATVPGQMNTTPDFAKLSELVDDVAVEGLGRVAMDLIGQLGNAADDFVLMDGDRLIVPRKPATVSIIGEVQMNSSHIFDERMSMNDYLSLAGGVTEFADTSKIYVIRADGRVFQPGVDWFSFADSEIGPGDTIVVPLDVNLQNNLGVWQQVTQIIYNSAVAVAAIRGL